MGSVCLYCMLYLSGGVAVMQQPSHPVNYPYTYWIYDINGVRNPYGTVELGLEHEVGRWRFQLAARHASSIPVGDHGQNTLEARLTWKPFGGGR